MRTAKKFRQTRNMPNCVGAIDGKHIRINAPEGGSLFYNYKGFFSIVLMAVCDADYRFTMVSVGACGSESDGGVLEKCWFGEKLLAGSLGLPAPRPLPGKTDEFPFYLIGDNAFPLHKNIMRPYPDRTASPVERQANKKLSSARMYIECTFGEFYLID